MKKILFITFLLFTDFFSYIIANDFVTYANYQRKAINVKNWNSAIKCTANMISNSDNSYVMSSSFLQLGALFLISGNKNNAASAIRKSIQMMGNSENIDTTLVTIAKKLLTRTKKFSWRLNNREKKILANYVSMLSNSVTIIQNGIDLAEKQRIATMQHNLLMQQYNNQINMIRNETRRMERNEKYKADRIYQNTTGDIFNPKYRPRDEYARRQWDIAKRVYDIFE